jgi:hypothetical protein
MIIPVITKAVLRATARPVCLAFIDAMAAYRVPEKVPPTTGRPSPGASISPGVPAEVLFDRICRENGIIHLLMDLGDRAEASGSWSATGPGNSPRRSTQSWPMPVSRS